MEKVNEHPIFSQLVSVSSVDVNHYKKGHFVLNLHRFLINDYKNLTKSTLKIHFSTHSTVPLMSTCLPVFVPIPINPPVGVIVRFGQPERQKKLECYLHNHHANILKLTEESTKLPFCHSADMAIEFSVGECCSERAWMSSGITEMQRESICVPCAIKTFSLAIW